MGWVGFCPWGFSGADYAYCNTACPPGFENLAASLHFYYVKIRNGQKLANVIFFAICFKVQVF
jgi:hypothetical protein